MKEPISIKEILAIVIRHGKTVILTALVLAIALGGLQGMKVMKTVNAPENAPEAVALRNEEAAAESELQTAVLNDYIATAKHRIEKTKEYLDEAPLMKLDPYNKFESHVVLSIAALDESEYVRAYQDTLGTPVDYVVAKILQQYELYWNKLDLNELLKGHPYEGTEESYLRELVSVARSQGSTLVITASADSAENASDLCQRIADAILALQPTIVEATFTHELVQISEATKQVVDYELDRNQIKTMEKLDAYLLELEDYEKKMDKIAKPEKESVLTASDAVKAAVKWAVLGGVAGFVLACGCVWLVYIVRDGVETSRQAEAILDAPYFGSAAGRKGFFHRAADRFVGERVWSDRDMAAAYIAENARTHLSAPASVAVLSTVKVQETDDAIQLILETLKNQGHTVRFAGCAEQNPAAVAALRESEYVVMAERLGTSNRSAMVSIRAQANQMNAKLLGFVTV